MRSSLKPKIICSSRNFFPKGAWFYSSKKQADIAIQAGYDAVEFLPTWRIVYEVWRYGRLLAPAKLIDSGHRDWRYDRIMEAKRHRRPWWWYQLRNKEDWLFPPSSLGLWAMRWLQKLYNVPVSVMWREDADNFSPVLMELWDTVQGFDQQSVLAWVKEDPTRRGLVIDTLKFKRWLKSNHLEHQEGRAIDELLPYVKSVDYRGARLNRKASMAVESEGKLTESERVFRLLVKKGYHGPVVVEFGWPDLDQPPFGLVNENWQQFIHLHQRLTKSIETLMHFINVWFFTLASFILKRRRIDHERSITPTAPDSPGKIYSHRTYT